MKRILSGITPSGDVQLGNYLGAMKRWGELAQKPGDECFFFVPNLHALTTRQDPKELAERTMSAVAWLLAVGIDYRRSYVYVQSLIPQHSELTWILSNYTTQGELSRMTQYKDKSQRDTAGAQFSGLFFYPVLMAADILLYDTDEVPVGEDQVQHIELARDIAERFNKLYGPVFKIPKATVQEAGARIMDLQDPTKKMSKSVGAAGCIFLTDSADVISGKIKRAVTDSSGNVRFHRDQPALSNLLTIYSLLSEESIKDIEARYKDKGYKDFKEDLAELTVKVVQPVQERYLGLMADRDKLFSIIQEGSERAEAIAQAKLTQVKATLGLI